MIKTRKDIFDERPGRTAIALGQLDACFAAINPFLIHGFFNYKIIEGILIDF